MNPRDVKRRANAIRKAMTGEAYYDRKYKDLRVADLHVSETIQEWTPSGKMVAEYHTTGSMPDYGYEEVNRRKAKKKVAEEWKKWQDKEATEQTKQWIEPPIIERATINKPIRIEITRGDITIKVEMDNHEEASKLITTIMKGD